MAVLLGSSWLQGQDLNLRRSGCEPDIFAYQSNAFPKGTESFGVLKKAPRQPSLLSIQISKNLQTAV